MNLIWLVGLHTKLTVCSPCVFIVHNLGMTLARHGLLLDPVDKVHVVVGVPLLTFDLCYTPSPSVYELEGPGAIVGSVSMAGRLPVCI